MENPEMMITGGDFRELMGRYGITVHPEGSGPYQYAEQTEAPSDHVRYVSPDEPLHTSQQYLHRPTLEHYIQFPYTYEWSHYDPCSHDGRVHVFTHQGETWLSQGHHRVLADRMTHRRGAMAGHYDVDAEEALTQSN
jgi:hypothetical protein